MLATALIVFRELLEAAVVVGIVLAATRSVVGHKRWISLGVGAGLLGAAVVAASASTLSQWADGMGQDIFNAGILIMAAVMLGWHSVWMSRHGRELARDLSAVGQSVSDGQRPLYAIAVVVAVAVLREGTEAALFLFGVAASEPGQAGAMFAGGAIGLLGGVGFGILIYAGLLKISHRHLFAVTNTLIILLAAGMASNAGGLLEGAGVVPSLGGALWNSEWLIPGSSLIGKVLHSLIGYAPRPTALQGLVYLATIGLLSVANRQNKSGKKPITVAA